MIFVAKVGVRGLLHALTTVKALPNFFGRKMLISTQALKCLTQKHAQAQLNLKYIRDEETNGIYGLQELKRQIKAEEPKEGVGFCNTDKEEKPNTDVGLLNTLTTPTPKEGQPYHVSYFEPEFTVYVNDCVRTIQIDRPANNNAMHFDMYEGVQNALHAANTDDSTKVVVLTGAGGNFLSRNDFFKFALATNSKNDALEIRHKLGSFVASFIDCEKPIVALVNGQSSGIGVNILGLVDIAYCIDKAHFSTPCYSHGMSPIACSSLTFPRIMGFSKASEMLYIGSTITAESAQALGLVSHVFPSHSFKIETSKRLKKLTRLPLEELIAIKKLVRGADYRKLMHHVNEIECDGFLKRAQSKTRGKLNISVFSNYIK